MTSFPNVRIFDVWHHRLFKELLLDIPMKDRRKIVCYGVNEKYEKEFDGVLLEAGFNIMFEYELPLYESIWQAKNYCQSSCLYHVYLNDDLYADMDYIGFMQYDMKCDAHAFANIESDIRDAQRDDKEIIFHENTIHLFEAVIQHEPCILTHALPHYNAFFGTNLTASDILHDPRCHTIPVVHTFVIPTSMFQRMMAWLSDYMKLLESDPSKYPFKCSQADYLERLHGFFLAIECKRDNVYMKQLDGIHHIWPLYHKQVKFDNYHVRIDS